ncbi:hypothetical protein NX776_06875 [Apilactobacillus kunkeei]|uniref:hypothetical protein n=1 Tax=Apilactobacillus kunkeei TaxID=148814 RepID=UPI0022005171|nr:hypothetical protein [Apilactobacillus kunkeei]MCX0326411.1 hypothetical protein [Apilactobacillus kunkeei]WJV43458.1 hypothetical protein QSV47_00195 [Apilactobacillus kunkeei]CAI2549161.1 hypothetical protein AKUH4B403J_00390 [Apilactobacillus kunkeei]CAI2549715.1 hypothetical protein AKUH4B103J_00390 [Apilactobacillus kunkeei]CAI2549741.1 hypothetical protein AKUH4B303J_00390 [Apilactobacillus kunkeei]
MKIKKSFLAILAVLTLFAASASTSVSAFTSVEANAATHHKDTKKHKKAKKSSKKHKKATKKSKKKATKKHSKKKVAKKKKKVTKKKPAKKAVKKHFVKNPAGPTPITYSHPTIDINPTGDNPIKAEYTYRQSKDYNIDISNQSNDSDNPHDITLRNVTYYQLSGNTQYKTAVVMQVLVKNLSSDSTDFFNTGSLDSDSTPGVYLSNNAGHQLSPAWGPYNAAATIPGNSQQVLNLTFVGMDPSTPADFSTFTFNYDVAYHEAAEFGPTINF